MGSVPPAQTFGSTQSRFSPTMTVKRTIANRSCEGTCTERLRRKPLVPQPAAVLFITSLSRVENSQLPRGVKEMVISSAPSSDTKPQVRHNLCPRCDASLVSSYHEPQCLQCGYVDYSYSPPTQDRQEEPAELQHTLRVQVHRRLSKVCRDAGARTGSATTQPDRVRCNVPVLRRRRGHGADLAQR